MPGGTPNFQTATQAMIENAAQERWDSDDLNDGQTLDSGRFVEAFSVQADRSTKYGPGLGYNNRNYATGWADLDLQGDNTNGNGTAVKGTMRWEYYSDSDKESLEFTSDTFRIETFRAYVSESLTDKGVMNALAPAVNEDGYLVLAVKVKSAYDGDSIDAAASTVDQGIPYSKYKV